MHYYGPPQARKILWFYYSQMVIYEYFGSAAGENFANSHIGSCENSTRKLKRKLWKLKRKLWKVSESEKEVVENGKLWKMSENPENR